MATITGLLKSIINLQDIIDSASDLVKVVDNVNSKIDKLAPNLKNAQSAFDGMNKTIEITNDLNKQLSFAWVNGDVVKADEIREKLASVDNITKKSFDLIIKGSIAAGNELEKLPPKFDNIQKITGLYQNLEKIQNNKSLILNSDETEKLNSTIEKVKNSIGIVFDNIAADIGKTIPPLKDVDSVFEKLANYKIEANIANNVLGDPNALKEQIEIAEYYTDTVLVKMANQIKELPPTLDNVTNSLEYLNTIQASAKDWTFGDTKSIEATKESILVLADKITDINPSIDGIRKVQLELNKLIALRDKWQEDGKDITVLNEVITRVQGNMSNLVKDVVSMQTSITSFQATVFGLQNKMIDLFQNILTELFQGVYKQLKPLRDIASNFLQNIGLIPDYISKAVIAAIGLITIIGLLNTQTLGLYLQTSYWVALWNSNVIVQGITGFIGLVMRAIVAMNGLTGATWVYNAAMWANPAGLILAAILVIIALVTAAIIALTYLWGYWGNTAKDSAEKAAQKTEMLNNVTEKYKNNLKEIIDYHKSQLDIMEKIREAALTPTQRAEKSIAELQKTIDEPQKLQQDIARLQSEIDNRKKLIANTKDAETIESFKKRNEEATKTLNELKELHTKMKPLEKEEISHKAISDLGLSSYATKEPTAFDKAKEAQDKINLLKTNKMIDNAQKDTMEKAVKAELLDSMGIAKAPSELIASFRATTEKLNQFADVFKENDNMKKAKENLLKNLQKDLGIDKYVNMSDMATERKKLMDEISHNIDLYKEQAGLTNDQIKVAKEKMQMDIMGRGDIGQLYYKIMDSMKPLESKIAEANEAIDKEAQTWGWDETIVEKMKEARKAELLNDPVNQSQLQQYATNEVIVKGSAAYTNYQNKNQNKQLEYAKNIRDNGKKQTELLAKSVKGIEGLGKTFDQCFEVV